MQELLESYNPWWRDPTARAASKPFRRNLQPKVLEAVENLADRRAQVVVGLRRVGKSVLLRQVAGDLLKAGWPPGNITHFDFNDYRILGNEPLSPSQVVKVVPPSAVKGKPRVLLLDEISKAKSWDRWLKQAVDQESFRIVATDSAASLLRAGTRESGLGRWDEARLDGLAFGEFLRIQRPDLDGSLRELLSASPQSFDRYLQVGGFPEHANDSSLHHIYQRIRNDIVGIAIAHDLAEHDVDVDRVRRLFVSLVQFSGSIVVSSRLGNQLDADVRTVDKWLQLLFDARLLVPLPLRGAGPGRSRGKPSSRLRARPKVFAADHGLVTAFAHAPEPLDNAAYRGSVWETVVFSSLREAVRDLEAEGPTYFRHGDELEIDFVVELAEGPVALEVTSSSPKSDKVKRLADAAERLGAIRSVLIHGGLATERRGSNILVPLQTFLLDPAGWVATREP